MFYFTIERASFCSFARSLLAAARQSILLRLCMIVAPRPAVLQSLKREPLVLYRTDHYRLARKTFKYIGLLIALLKRSNTNKNMIFKVL